MDIVTLAEGQITIVPRCFFCCHGCNVIYKVSVLMYWQKEVGAKPQPTISFAHVGFYTMFWISKPHICA
jgi:hypothetical protein